MDKRTQVIKFFNHVADSMLAIYNENVGQLMAVRMPLMAIITRMSFMANPFFVLLSKMVSGYSIRNKASDRNLILSAIIVEMALAEMGTVDLLWESC